MRFQSISCTPARRPRSGSRSAGSVTVNRMQHSSRPSLALLALPLAAVAIALSASQPAAGESRAPDAMGAARWQRAVPLPSEVGTRFSRTDLRGVDVSNWQGRVDWSKVAANGIRFAFLKASQGTTYSDPTYATNRSAARAAGVRVGAYHFAVPGGSTRAGITANATAQADYFIAATRPAETDLRPVLDIERTGGLAPAQLVRWTNAFSSRVAALVHARPLVYTSPSFWQTELGDSQSTAAIADLWIAHWTTAASPWVPAGDWAGRGVLAVQLVGERGRDQRPRRSGSVRRDDAHAVPRRLTPQEHGAPDHRRRRRDRKHDPEHARHLGRDADDLLPPPVAALQRAGALLHRDRGRDRRDVHASAGRLAEDRQAAGRCDEPARSDDGDERGVGADRRHHAAVTADPLAAAVDFPDNAPRSRGLVGRRRRLRRRRLRRRDAVSARARRARGVAGLAPGDRPRHGHAAGAGGGHVLPQSLRDRPGGETVGPRAQAMRGGAPRRPRARPHRHLAAGRSAAVFRPHGAHQRRP